MVSLQAQNKTQQVHRPKVGVVLGGGGAKGASHIGVLKYLEEMGIPVDFVAGTSMGSIIGGFYAMGYSPDDLTEIISGINWSEYIGNKIDRPLLSHEMRQLKSTTLIVLPFDLKSIGKTTPNANFISSLPSAYVNNSSLINLFNDLCVGYQREMDFNDLPIPFACVATDIVTGEEVVLRHGSVPTAMRASMAIPGVFAPVAIDDYLLVDGGLVNNFPADVLREMGADIIIGVEITSEKKITQEDIKSLPQLLGRLVTNITGGKRKENRELCDVRIIPDVSGFGMLSFTPEAIDTLVNRGYQQAQKYHDQFQAIKDRVNASTSQPVTKTLQAPQAKNLAKDPVLIHSITLNNVNEKENRWLLRKSGLKPNTVYSRDDLEHAMKIFRGTGCFDEITYQIVECDSARTNSRLSEAYDLSINIKHSQPHVLGLGMRYDTEDGAALLLKACLNEKKFSGSKLDLTAKLSYSPHIRLTYTYSRSSLANFNLSAAFRSESFRILTENIRGTNLRYFQSKASAYISQFHLLNFSTAVGASYYYTSFDNAFLQDNVLDSIFLGKSSILIPYIQLTYDNLDDAYFAKHGIYANLKGQYHMDLNQMSDRGFDLGYSFQGYITPLDGKVTIIPQLYGQSVSESSHFQLWVLTGGEIAGRHFENQLPFIGVSSAMLSEDHSCVLRCDLRYNFYGDHYLTAMYNYMLSGYWSPEIKKFEFSDVADQGAGLKYSYNSILGPVSLTAQWAKIFGKHVFGAYASFGFTF